jgi:pimeloyl-ACP methyl ester carboxylesterase
MNWIAKVSILHGACLILAACSSDSSNPDVVAEVETDEACPVVVRDADCDKSQRPIVFVHGNYGSGDNIANVALLFTSNGFCADRFVAIDYSSLAPADQQPGLDGRLDALIDEVLAETGADKVDLMGHSNGTINSRNYLLEGGTGAVIQAHAAKVAHFVHLAGGPLPVPDDPPTLCVASNSDTIATGLCPPNAAETAIFEEKDHFAVASSDESFVAIYEFLRGEEPKYKTIQCGAREITLEGKAESFADNVVPVGSTLEVYELGSDARKRGSPIDAFTVGDDGVIVPFKAKRLQMYEFRAIDEQGVMIGHQYIAPFKRDNRLIRFLGPSEALALVTDNIVRDDRHSAVIARSYKGAFRSDLGDSLKANGAEVLLDEIANAASATVGLFMFDENTNGTSDGGSLGAYSALPFIRGTDVFMDSATPGFIELTFNGEVLKVPNWPSQSEGPMIVIFP